MAADGEVKVNIKITSDGNGGHVAIGTLNKVAKSVKGLIAPIHAVRGAISGLMGAFGMIGFAIDGIKKLYELCQSAYEWMHRAEKEAKALREELEKTAYETKVAGAALAYEKLNKRLAENVRLEKERNAIIDARKSTERDLEDAESERKKQVEIAALDPTSKDYAANKAEIERRYALDASDRTAARAKEDARNRAKGLYDDAAGKEREGNALEGELRRAERILGLAQDRAWSNEMAIRRGEEGAEEKQKSLDDARNAAYDFWKKIKDQIDALRADADSLRRKAAEAGSGGLSANIRAEAYRTGVENAQREKDAQDAEKKRKENLTNKRKIEDAQRDRQKAEEIAALDPTDKSYGRKKAEIERRYALTSAEEKVNRAETAADRDVAKEDLAKLKAEQEAESRKELAEEREKQQSDLDRALEGRASVDAVSQNRLTAMGLGSGVSASGSVANDVRKLVTLMEKEIQVTIDNKPVSDYDYPAYSE